MPWGVFGWVSGHHFPKYCRFRLQIISIFQTPPFNTTLQNKKDLLQLATCNLHYCFIHQFLFCSFNHCLHKLLQKYYSETLQCLFTCNMFILQDACAENVSVYGFVSRCLWLMICISVCVAFNINW